MKVVSVSKLKATLSHYIARVKQGERLEVTERGKVVAVLSPPPVARTSEEQEIRRLEAAGIVKRGKRKIPGKLPRWPMISDPEGKVRKAVIAEREQGW